MVSDFVVMSVLVRLAPKEKAAAAAKIEAAKVAAAQPVSATAVSAPQDDAQAKIQAAIANAQQQAAAAKPKNTEQLTPQQQAEIADIEARRARIHELAATDIEAEK